MPGMITVPIEEELVSLECCRQMEQDLEFLGDEEVAGFRGT